MSAVRASYRVLSPQAARPVLTGWTVDGIKGGDYQHHTEYWEQLPSWRPLIALFVLGSSLNIWAFEARNILQKDFGQRKNNTVWSEGFS